uniref:Spherulin-like protein n=1 Tax=Adineta vaga TaxID=104782 RepID=G3KGV8_ADIVA|nr:spherulin-like protein [Adineta vaga]
MIGGTSLLVGFIQENRAQVVLNEIQVGYATLILRGAIHFVQHLGCTPSVQINAYNNADPGLLTLGLNMFRCPDGVPSTTFGQTEDFIMNSKRTISAYPLDVNEASRTKCGLPI